MRLNDILRSGKKVLASALATAVALPIIYCSNPSGDSDENSAPVEDVFSVEAGSVGKCVEFQIDDERTVCILDAPQAPENFNVENYNQKIKLQKVYGAEVLAKSFDNVADVVESGCLQVHDQGNLGSCVADSVNASLEAMLCKTSGNRKIRASEPHLLWMGKGDKKFEEVFEGGWTAIAAYNILGGSLEAPASVWPYSKKIQEMVDSQPELSALEENSIWGTMDYFYVPGYDVESLKSAVSDGANVALAVPVYKDAKWRSRSGEPKSAVIEYTGGDILGYHNILVVGWDSELNQFKFLNSWGSQWGEEGFGYLTAEFVEKNNCQGFYVLKPRGCVNDLDGDGHYVNGEKECVIADDLCDDDSGNWTWDGCKTCSDSDGDFYGVNCDLGEDCDDSDSSKFLYNETGDACAEVSDLECVINSECVALYGNNYYCTSSNVCDEIPVEPECTDNSDCVTLYGTGYFCNSYDACEEEPAGCSVTGCPTDYFCNSLGVCEANPVSDGTWTDSDTGLTWMENSPNATYTHAQAVDYCSNLVLGGKSDWRLPTIGELRTVDVGCSEMNSCDVGISCYDSTSSCFNRTYCECDNLSWDDLFLERGAFYWSSSAVSNESGYYWGLESKYSNIEPLPEGYGLYVNCVRED